MRSWIVLLCALSLLVGCKSELYGKLDEIEANQMLALLIYNKIPAHKTVGKEGVSLQVEGDRFVDAVEVLRHHGLPRHKTTTMQDLFPSGQLVSSPEQEEAKLNYLKSQQLEKMLSSMDGVMNAEVSVAKPSARDGEPAEPASAAVFIKYSPEVNLPVRESEIRTLVRNGIPGLTPERISLTMQRAEYRYLPQPEVSARSPMPWAVLVAVGGTMLMATLVAATWRWRRRSGTEI